MKISYLIVSIFAFLLFSCKDDPVKVKTGNLKFDVQYNVDNAVLMFDTVVYTNASGNKYSLNHLEYFLSGFTFSKSDGSSYKSGAVCYVNAEKPLTNGFSIGNIPQGDYTQLSFYIGLDASQNKTNYLPLTLENVNMAWPDAMGGGYHFMKMEGYFMDKSGTVQNGYAMHLGKDLNLIKLDFTVPLSITDETLSRTLTMNINEWYKNPALYDFDTDGNYSMGVQNAMSKLAQNGKDVFTIK